MVTSHSTILIFLLRETMEDKNISQVKLAVTLGIARQSVTRMLSGEHKVDYGSFMEFILTPFFSERERNSITKSMHLLPSALNSLGITVTHCRVEDDCLLPWIKDNLIYRHNRHVKKWSKFYNKGILSDSFIHLKKDLAP